MGATLMRHGVGFLSLTAVTLLLFAALPKYTAAALSYKPS
jgi:hypothetical protein